MKKQFQLSQQPRSLQMEGKKTVQITLKTEKKRTSITNEASTGNVSGLLNIIIQIPIQIAINTQNLSESDENSTTTI